MYIRGPSGAKSGLVAAKYNVGSQAEQCHVHSNVMAPSSYGRGTLLNSVWSLRFTADISVFTNDMHHHDTSVGSQDTYAAASGLMHGQR
jgi:hypothetical protein